MPGPPPKSSTLRQRWAKRPEIGTVSAEPTKPIVPLPPSGLLKGSRQRWTDFFESPVAAAVTWPLDRHRVERWIRAVDELERVYPSFKKERVTSGSQGQLVMHPLMTYIRQLEMEISKSEAELGMTPMARLKLGMAIGEAKRTAAQLNEELNRGDSGPSEPSEDPGDFIEAEWAEA